MEDKSSESNPTTDLEVLGKLLALLAHDLRNPLSALHSNLGFLGSVLQAPDPDVQDAIADGLISCDGLSHIIDNIDLLGQSLRGAAMAAPGPLTAVPFVQELVKRSAAVAQSHGLSVALTTDESEAQTEVFTNQELLGRCLSNLIRNSIQHSPSRSTVDVYIRREGDELIIRVSDVGSVIPRENWALAFTPRGQVHAKSEHGGRYSRGMGLYSAQLAADVAGASVAVVQPPESYKNSFELRIPIHSP